MNLPNYYILFLLSHLSTWLGFLPPCQPKVSPWETSLSPGGRDLSNSSQLQAVPPGIQSLCHSKIIGRLVCMGEGCSSGGHGSLSTRTKRPPEFLCLDPKLNGKGLVSRVEMENWRMGVGRGQNEDRLLLG